MNPYLRLTLKYSFRLACWCVMAFAFMSIGIYAAHSWQMVEQSSQALKLEQAKYEAQRTADMVSLIRSTKPDMGCPVEEVRQPLKKGKSKKVC